jgi:hypothetical protein
MWVVVWAPAGPVKMMFPLASIVCAWQATHPVRAMPVGCPENCGGVPWQVAPHAPLPGETQLGVCSMPGVLSVLSGSPPPWQYAPVQLVELELQTGDALWALAKLPEPATFGKTVAAATVPGACPEP